MILQNQLLTVPELFPNKMLSWNLLKTFSYQNPPRITLGRSDEVNQAYIKHRMMLERQEIDVSTYLIGKYFMNDDEYNGKEYVFDKNMFPYLCEEGIEHNVLWIHNSISIDENFIQNIEEIICRKYFENKDDMNENCVFFRNIEQLRSVKGLPHIHIFIRK